MQSDEYDRQYHAREARRKEPPVRSSHSSLRGVDKVLIEIRTGTHTVADLLCAGCNAPLGWMYIKAPNGEQRYKEGKPPSPVKPREC